jgi:hypothetical protein
VSELRGKADKLPKGMKGAAECVAGKYGDGRVVLISAHHETSANLGPHGMFRQLFRYAAGILDKQ